MQQFDDFILCQKIDEDSLGTLYRAKRIDAVHDEYVLLRLFDKGSVDVARFQIMIVGREALARTLASPHLAPSFELGVAGDQPFCAFADSAGRSLRTWIDRSKERHLLFPLDAALRIVGDLASGLREAYLKPIGGVELLHGFLVPQLVLTGADGRTRLCHLEAAPALRRFRASAQRFHKLLPYLSPEMRQGEHVHPTDDVYSLGSLLYEMLTLEPVTSRTTSFAEALGPHGARSDLRYFLDRSLAPRFRRFQSVVEWRRELESLISTHHLSAGTEDVALFIGALEAGRATSRRPRYDTMPLTAEDRDLLNEALPEDFRSPAVTAELPHKLRPLAFLG